MIQKISEPVSVNFNLSPKLVTWRGRSYEITQVGLHHTYREGRVLYHVFSVVSASLFMRLVLNTETLSWRLEETHDGL